MLLASTGISMSSRCISLSHTCPVRLAMLCDSSGLGPAKLLQRPACIEQVTIGQKTGQAQRSVSRFLWDVHTDGAASEYYENESLFCVCQVCPAGKDRSSACPSNRRTFCLTTESDRWLCVQVYGLYFL